MKVGPSLSGPPQSRREGRRRGTPSKPVARRCAAEARASPADLQGSQDEQPIASMVAVRAPRLKRAITTEISAAAAQRRLAAPWHFAIGCLAGCKGCVRTASSRSRRAVRRRWANSVSQRTIDVKNTRKPGTLSKGEHPSFQVKEKLDGPAPAGVPFPSRAALGVFALDVCEALAEAAIQQQRSLAGAELRLAALAQRSQTEVGPAFARALKAEITDCLADAAAENVRIWTALTTHVRTSCARLEATAGADGGATGGAAAR